MCDLRLGSAASLYYKAANRKMPSQLNLLDIWFPGLIVMELDPEGKQEAEYRDTAFKIYASRINGSFFLGDADRVIQILGRLNGTAKGNQEKERRTAFLIQKHLAEVLVTDLEAMASLKQHVQDLVEQLNETQMEMLCESIYQYIDKVLQHREAGSEYELLNELFPMDSEVFEGILYNTVYQLRRGTSQSIAAAYLWLLLGGLLRNEAGRLIRLYDSGFVPIYRHISEDGTIRDKLHYLLHREEYESFYEGDDLDKQFPGVEWYCDRCGDYLNVQDGFDDHQPAWICRKCGYENLLNCSEIYVNEEDYRNQMDPVDEEDFKEALDRRTAEVNHIHKQ